MDEMEKLASDAADYADHIRDEARDEEAIRQLKELEDAEA